MAYFEYLFLQWFFTLCIESFTIALRPPLLRVVLCEIDTELFYFHLKGLLEKAN